MSKDYMELWKRALENTRAMEEGQKYSSSPFDYSKIYVSEEALRELGEWVDE